MSRIFTGIKIFQNVMRKSKTNHTMSSNYKQKYRFSIDDFLFDRSRIGRLIYRLIDHHKMLITI